MSFTAIGAIALAAAVGLGAFGAHGLQGRLDSYSMNIYERAVFYHFIHALGILIVAPSARAAGRGVKRMRNSGEMAAPGESVVRESEKRGGRALVCWLLLAGIVLFSGSLYALALTGIRTLGAVTPFGGVSFIAAWVVLAITEWRAHPPGP
ncbi:MAG TPA: DUF423 domain-containing protein [Bryobacteraceae bacterium]